MLHTVGILLILLQFGLDGFFLYTRKAAFRDTLDIVGWFLFGLIGIALCTIDSIWKRLRIQRLYRNREEKDED